MICCINVGRGLDSVCFVEVLCKYGQYSSSVCSSLRNLKFHLPRLAEPLLSVAHTAESVSG